MLKKSLLKTIIIINNLSDIDSIVNSVMLERYKTSKNSSINSENTAFIQPKETFYALNDTNENY